jgi:transaldolase
MTLYIDSAFLNDIMNVAQTVPIAGAHDLTVTPQVLMEMVRDPLTEEAVERFTQDWQKMNKS